MTIKSRFHKEIKYLKDNTKYDYSVYTKGGKMLIGGATLKKARHFATKHALQRKGNMATITKKICRARIK